MTRRQELTRKQKLKHAFTAHGITDAAKLESHLRGCDLTRPVSIKNLTHGECFEVWVRDGGYAGKYAAPIGEDPARLGIMIAGRHLEVFEVTRALSVVSCTAAVFPAGLVDLVGGDGGGTQYILPPNWQTEVKRIK